MYFMAQAMVMLLSFRCVAHLCCSNCTQQAFWFIKNNKSALAWSHFAAKSPWTFCSSSEWHNRCRAVLLMPVTKDSKHSYHSKRGLFCRIIATNFSKSFFCTISITKALLLQPQISHSYEKKSAGFNHILLCKHCCNKCTKHISCQWICRYRYNRAQHIGTAWCYFNQQRLTHSPHDASTAQCHCITGNGVIYLPD